MKLTNAHRRALKYYQRLHGTRPTMLSLLALVWWRYLLVVIAAAIAVLILPSALNFLLAGFVLGMVFRDLQRFRHWARLWQMYEQILAWDEIEALLAPNGRPMAALLVTQPSAARSHGWRAAPTSPRPGD